MAVATARRLAALACLAIASSGFAQAGAARTATRKVVVLAMRGERLGDATPTARAFEDELTTLGWDRARVVVSHLDVDGGVAALPAAAAAAADQHPDVIVASGTMQALAASRVTKTIPIVTAVADPVAYHLSAADLRPLANVTGSSLSADFWAAKVRLLRRIAPAVTRLYIIADPGYDPGWPVDATQAAARALDLPCTTIMAHGVEDLREWFARTERPEVEGVIVANSPALARAIAAPLGAFAARSKLAVIAPYPDYARAGALLALEEDGEFRCRRLAAYVDKLLKGSTVADLPFERIDRPRITINLRTAGMLHLAIPADVLASATTLR